MALSANTVFEIRTTGLDTNSGGFVTGASGTDYSQQNSPQYSVTDGVTAGTTTITSATAAFGTDVVGNLIYVQGGTGSITAGWYQITSRTNATTIVVDRSTGLSVGTGATLHIGGALASPAQAAALLVANNYVWQKSGTYTITAAGSNVATGIVSVGALIAWQGYGTTRGDDAAAPLLQVINDGSLVSVTVFSTAITNVVVRNISIDGSSQTGIKGFAGNLVTADLITVSNCKNDGLTNLGGFISRCRATNVTGGAGAFNCGNSVILWCCEADANTVVGFNLNALSVAAYCIARSNTGSTIDGFAVIGGRPAAIINCISYANGRDGIRVQQSGNIWGTTIINTICEGNVAGWGISTAGAAANARWANIINCAGYNNALGNVDTNFAGYNLNFKTLTASPFTNAGSADFSLNNTASAGAACRAAGIISIPSITTPTSYIDIGTYQHKDAGGLLLNPSLEGL